MQMTARGPDFSEFARRIAEGFCGMGLKDADDRLADARHVLWGNHFTGFPMAEVAFGAGVSQEALTLADAIATEGKGNLHAMEEILFEVRAVLFVTACGIRPGSPFGLSIQAMEAALARRFGTDGKRAH